jgi:hypothetical protein
MGYSVLRLVNLSSVALALMLFGEPRPFTHSGNIDATAPSRSDSLLATITESVPSAVITTDEAPIPRKGSVPSSLLVRPRKKEVHNGNAIRDMADRALARTGYGYSQIFDYTVLDQEGSPFRRGGMKVREEITFVAGNVDVGHDRPGSLVPIDEEGRFSDLQALFTETYPPLPPGSFLKFKQKVIINYKNQEYLLGIVCIDQRVDEVVLTAFSRPDASCE